MLGSPQFRPTPSLTWGISGGTTTLLLDRISLNSVFDSVVGSVAASSSSEGSSWQVSPR
jgi:hypothetical protein